MVFGIIRYEREKIQRINRRIHSYQTEIRFDLSPNILYSFGSYPNMFDLTRQEQLIALILIGGIIIGGVVLWIRRDPAPPTPEPLEYEVNLSDGEHGRKGNTLVEPEHSDESDSETPGSELIDVNTASTEELEVVPGIGPKTAETIIKYREAFGPFENINELIEVPGIGEKKLEKFKEYMTVNREEESH